MSSRVHGVREGRRRPNGGPFFGSKIECRRDEGRTPSAPITRLVVHPVYALKVYVCVRVSSLLSVPRRGGGGGAEGPGLEEIDVRGSGRTTENWSQLVEKSSRSSETSRLGVRLLTVRDGGTPETEGSRWCLDPVYGRLGGGGSDPTHTVREYLSGLGTDKVAPLELVGRQTGLPLKVLNLTSGCTVSVL